MCKKPKNILVFPCGSEIALDIHSSVRYSRYFHLIGGNSADDHGKFVYDDYIGGIPFIADTSFIPTIKRIVLDRQIDAVYPAMDAVITILKEHEAEIGCRVIAPSVKTTEISLSKELTYKELNGVIRLPKVFTAQHVEEFPCFAKPKIGYGANGTMKLCSQIEVDTFLKDKQDVLLLEYLPGDEYTVDCFTDRHGKLLYAAARKRSRVKSGVSVNTSFVESQHEFRVLAEKINEKIDFRGAWFYQVKRDKTGELCLLEIASRLGGSSLLSRAVGVNLALLTLFDAFDYEVTVGMNSYQVELDRAFDARYKTDIQFDAVYCDYDDCLILDKTKVNEEIVKFLYQCFNRGKKLYLLSKHENSDLMEELKHFRISNLFDEVIHIEPSADKSQYITSPGAIFIDDSNAERENVRQKLKIPVFAPEMIDVLIN